MTRAPGEDAQAILAAGRSRIEALTASLRLTAPGDLVEPELAGYYGWTPAERSCLRQVTAYRVHCFGEVFPQPMVLDDARCTAAAATFARIGRLRGETTERRVLRSCCRGPPEELVDRDGQTSMW